MPNPPRLRTLSIHSDKLTVAQLVYKVETLEGELRRASEQIRQAEAARQRALRSAADAWTFSKVMSRLDDRGKSQL